MHRLLSSSRERSNMARLHLFPQAIFRTRRYWWVIEFTAVVFICFNWSSPSRCRSHSVNEFQRLRPNLSDLARSGTPCHRPSVPPHSLYLHSCRQQSIFHYGVFLFPLEVFPTRQLTDAGQMGAAGEACVVSLVVRLVLLGLSQVPTPISLVRGRRAYQYSVAQPRYPSRTQWRLKGQDRMAWVSRCMSKMPYRCRRHLCHGQSTTKLNWQETRIHRKHTSFLMASTPNFTRCRSQSF